MAHDVFISHSSKDKPIADAVCAALETEKIRCWIAPRDIQSGEQWPEAIVNAITASRIMVLIFSTNSNNSKDVANELILAMNSEVIVIPLKIDDILPKGVMQYYLTGAHWLDAMNPPTEKQVHKLVGTVKSFMSKPAAEDAAGPEEIGTESRQGMTTAPVLSAGFITAVKPSWYWAGTAMTALWLAWSIILLRLLIIDGWGYGIWYNNWFTNFLFFLLLSVPLLAPAIIFLRQGIAGDFLDKTADQSVNRLWWILPVILGLIGGVITWINNGNISRRTALNMLTLGILLTPVWAIPLFVPGIAPEISVSMNIIGSWPSSRTLHNVFVEDNLAYLANGGDGLVMLNVEDLSNPQEIGSYPLENARNVVVNNGIAYVTEQGQIDGGRVLPDKLVLIDVDNPLEPVKLGEYSPEDQHIYRTLNNLAVADNRVYLTASGKLFIVDVSAPAEPVTLGMFEFNSNVVSPGVAVVDNTAYLIANRFHVVDVKDPANPVEIGGFDCGWGSSVAVIDDTAYIAGWDDGLTILDVSMPSRPVKLGHFKEFFTDFDFLPPGTSGRQTTLHLSVSGNIVYLTYVSGVDHGTWTQIMASGVAAIDVSNPAEPRLIDVFTEIDEASGVFAVGDLIFAADSNRGLYILGVR